MGQQHSLARGIGMIGRREEQQCKEIGSMACINVLRGNSKIHGKLLHAQCAHNIFIHLNTYITAMKFYNQNPSYTLKTEYDTEFYNSESRILDTSTAICKYTLVHCSVFRSHILMVLSLSPDTIFWSSYCRQ